MRASDGAPVVGDRGEVGDVCGDEDATLVGSVGEEVLVRRREERDVLDDSRHVELAIAQLDGDGAAEHLIE